MVHTGLRDDSDHTQVNPLPEENIFWHDVRLHFSFHFNVEYLNRFVGVTPQRQHLDNTFVYVFVCLFVCLFVV